ncbi:hypothetical protein BDQ12DRAFT_678315 [Crucibulum laeve]|uniref:E3 ubiquitin-protein ligase listerin n=1 Tax=Crucibulum laeve TaxID=68775 RepID=A0A5C3M8T2_9AGAR|nr:hypothetical protein BDQ12DRAFT_678315 [Crucibulum laeve]
MVKGHGKSSATSATRKKHAKKTVGPQQDESIPKEKKPKKSERGKKKEPRPKMYIPPVKPAPVQPDPLETTGLAHSLPPDLLVVLRSFNKKAQVTKIRALEDLQANWVEKCQKEGEDGTLVYTLVEMLPVWLHHVSSLFVHPSRRVRFLTATLHTSLLHLPPVRDQIFFYLRESASTAQLEAILGTWCIAAHDVDRSVASATLKAWKDAISYPGSPDTADRFVLNDNPRSSLVSFVQRTALDPSGAYAYLNPAPPVVSTPIPKKSGRGLPPVQKAEPESTRSKAEEMEESESDRRARLRVGALGAIRWVLSISPSISEDTLSFLSNPVLWTALHHAESCPWVEIENFGFSQPIVRKSAWGLVQTLLVSQKTQLQTLVPALSPAILRSAWVEPDSTVQSVMWQPLLTFLKEFPSSWEIERAQSLKKDEDADEDDEDEDEDEDEDGEEKERQTKSKEPTASPSTAPSLAYLEFLQFLQLGCSGSPLQGYPTVVIILSTIPSSILASSTSTISPLIEFFTSFWAAIDGRALSSLKRSATSAAFLSSLLECMIFLIKRLRRDESRSPSSESDLAAATSTPTQEAHTLVQEQFARLWEELSTYKLKVEDRAAARLMGQTLDSLYDIDPELYQAAWHTLASLIKRSADTNPTLVSTVLKVFYDRFKDGTPTKEAASMLLGEVLNTVSVESERNLRMEESEGVSAPKGSFELLVSMLDQFREGLFRDSTFTERIDLVTSENAYLLISTSPSLLLSYLQHRKEEQQCLRTWRALLAGYAAHPEAIHKAIRPVLESTQRHVLPKYLKPETDELDELAGRLLAGDSNDLALAQRILLAADYFISFNGFVSLLQNVISTFNLQVDLVLGGDEQPLFTFGSSLDLILSIFKNPPAMLKSLEAFDNLLPSLFIFAYLFPECGINAHSSFGVAKELWAEWLKIASDRQKIAITGAIKAQLRSLITDPQVRPVPEDILRMLAQKPPGLSIDLLFDILPSTVDMQDMLSHLPAHAIDPSLAVINPLVPPSTPAHKHHQHSDRLFDRRGFGSYARATHVLLSLFLEERQLAKQNIWALQHFLALSIYAHDFQSVPSAQSPVFDSKALVSDLTSMILKIRQITTYLLLSSQDENWCQHALSAITDQKYSLPLNPLAQFLVDMINKARESDTVRDARVLGIILEHVLDDIEKPEGELWVMFARKLERSAAETSMTIIRAVVDSATEPLRLDRYRNELAAALLGIPPNRANTEGLLTLRKLAATAPDSESEVVFLPQLRAVNAVKACQDWIGSDEDIDEKVESEMTVLFLNLAPILQNVPGSHWEFIFDVLESNLENSHITEDTSLVQLSRSLRLFIVIQDLALSNKSLRADWEARKVPILTMVRDLATVKLDAAGVSLPRSICRELVLSIVQDLPPSLIDQETLPKMCHLVTDPSNDVQKMAYQLLHSAAKKRTEHLVIEAGVDSEDAVKAELPLELLDILQRNINFNLSDEDDEQNIFGHLLGWMLLFDLFQDASFKVRSSYIEQIRNLNIIVGHFIPCFLGLLQLDEGLTKAFKLDIWAVDEFYVEHYEPGTSFGIPLFAAHLYYRALLTVPSLIHGWLLDCKDRQLTSTITTYTSQHFSPVIIRAELTHVKDPGAVVGIADENMTIKVAAAVNEVVASYLVDEHQLEIKLKIPTDWPLHKIEVKDMKRVGVDENRWRAWILAVQQTIWAHNGRILDGLELFKKNVTLHFEGQVECAICYSIISVMDGSLPRKPCKTCKNRFHAGCLYKWFNSSHSSSCPLCRSDII